MFANSLKYFFRKVLIPIHVIANEILKELLVVLTSTTDIYVDS